jgi:hypothetical protein
MPKLTFPAAGEAMPAAEEMPVIGRFSRRVILGAFASVPAIGGATAALGAVSTLPDARRGNHRRSHQAPFQGAVRGNGRVAAAGGSGNAEGARLWLARAKS